MPSSYSDLLRENSEQKKTNQNVLTRLYQLSIFVGSILSLFLGAGSLSLSFISKIPFFADIFKIFFRSHQQIHLRLAILKALIQVLFLSFALNYIWIFALENQPINLQVSLTLGLLFLALTILLEFSSGKFSINKLISNNVSLITSLLLYSLLLINSNFLLDRVLALVLLSGQVYNLWQTLEKVLNLSPDKENKESNFSSKNHASENNYNSFFEPLEIPDSSLQKILEYPKIVSIENAYAYKNPENNEKTAVLNLIVDNRSSQEDIFEARNFAKKKLISSNFENSFVEIKYEIETRMNLV